MGNEATPTYFRIPELEIWYNTTTTRFILSFFMRSGGSPYHPGRFNRYEESMKYVYDIVENNELELSLESYVTLIKECRKIGVLDGIKSK